MIKKFKINVEGAALCRLQLSSEEANKLTINVSDCLDDCKEIILVSTLDGFDTGIMHSGTEITFVETKATNLLIFYLRAE